jgi:uncharacterized protein (TIGR02246 family)
MRTLLVALLVMPSLALGAEKGAGTSEDPMAGWVPPKVKAEAKDKQEIQALFKGMETAARTGDLDAAAALVDFPVMMMTDDSRGDAMGSAWSRERWTEAMKPFYGKPMKDMKVTHKPNIFLLSDSLAVVTDVATMAQGGKSITSRNSMFLIRKDGAWRVKAMAEGGWGDMMSQAREGSASAPQEPASQGTGNAAGAQGPASQGTGSAAGAPPATEGSGSGAKAPPETPAAPERTPPERTTK